MCSNKTQSVNNMFTLCLFTGLTSDTGCASCAAAGLGSSGSGRRTRRRLGCSCRCCGRTQPTFPPTAAGRRRARPPGTHPSAGGRRQRPQQRPQTRAEVGASCQYNPESRSLLTARQIPRIKRRRFSGFIFQN